MEWMEDNQLLYAQELFLQVVSKDIVVKTILSLPGWPSIEIQERLFLPIQNTIKTYPPSKKWLSAVFNALEYAISQSNLNAAVENNMKSYEISDILAELIVFNISRVDNLDNGDDRDISHAIYRLNSISSIFRTYRSHNQVGTRIWEAGLFLIEFLASLNSNFFETQSSIRTNNLNIIELGTGVGITGIMLKKIYPHVNIYLTDYATDVLELLEENVLLNFPFPNDIEQSNHQDRIETRGIILKRLDWSLISSELCHTMNSDLILAADCTYDPISNVDLVHTIKTLLISAKEKRRNPIDSDDSEDKSSRSIEISLDLTLTTPCALVACTVRNIETFQQFLSLLESEKDYLEYMDIIDIIGNIDIHSKIRFNFHYENKHLIRLIYIR